jgi:hypothetical protein
VLLARDAPRIGADTAIPCAAVKLITIVLMALVPRIVRAKLARDAPGIRAGAAITTRLPAILIVVLGKFARDAAGVGAGAAIAVAAMAAVVLVSHCWYLL